MSVAAGAQQPASVEFRAGLVLYGGVSLAVYMGGVCTEFLEAVRATREPPPGEPLPENHYRDLLEILDGKFVVDVISGTSAGGINGVFLARALTCDGDMAGMDDLWQQQGDFAVLTNWGRTEPKSVLNGVVFQDELKKAMRKTGKADGRSLVPALDLHVTATDLAGQYWARADVLRHTIRGHDHARIFTLKYREEYPLGPDGAKHGYQQNDFRNSLGSWEETSDYLAKLCRTTAAFPGVFEPIGLTQAEVAATGEAPDNRSQVWMTDGGVLQNRPFAPTLKTIFHRTADKRVERLLFYVEPTLEAQREGDGPLSREPNALAVAFKALITIPMYQSISQHLRAIDEHNQTVEHLRTVLADLEADLAEQKQAADPNAPPEVEPPAAGGEAGLTYDAYRQIRRRELVRSLQGRLTGLVRSLAAEGRSTGVSLNPEVNAAAAAKALAELIKKSPASPGFLSKYDILYHQRRLHYLIEQCGLLYYIGEECQVPAQAALRRDWEARVTAQEARLWRALEHLRMLEWAMWSRLPAETEAEKRKYDPYRPYSLWGKQNPTDPAALLGALADLLAAWHAQAGGEIAAATRELNTLVQERRDRLMAAGDSQSSRKSPDFEHIRRYFWMRDVLLFPLEIGTELGERDVISWVRISPYDADAIFQRAPQWGTQLDYAERLDAGARKIAGDTLSNFGGFLSWRWRANDFMWGRLDGVDLIVQHLVRVAEDSGRYCETEMTEIRRVAGEARLAAFKTILKKHLHRFGKEQLAEYITQREVLQERSDIRTSAQVGEAAERCVRAARALLPPPAGGPAQRPGTGPGVDQAATAQAHVARWGAQLQAELNNLTAQVGKPRWQMPRAVQQAQAAALQIAETNSVRADHVRVLQTMSQALESLRPPARVRAGVKKGVRQAVYVDSMVDELTWPELHEFLMQYYQTGGESVADLHPGLAAHAGIGAAENLRRVIGTMVTESGKPVPPFVLKLGQALGYPIQWLAAVVKPLIPRPAIGSDDRMPPLWKWLALAVTLSPMVFGYLSGWAGWEATAGVLVIMGALGGIGYLGLRWWRKGDVPRVSWAPWVLLSWGAALALFGFAPQLNKPLLGTLVTPLQLARVLGVGMLLLWLAFSLGVLVTRTYYLKDMASHPRRTVLRVAGFVLRPLAILLAIPVVLFLAGTVYNQIRSAGLPAPQSRTVTAVPLSVGGQQGRGFPAEGIVRTRDQGLWVTTLDGYVLAGKGDGAWTQKGQRFATAMGITVADLGTGTERILLLAQAQPCRSECQGALYEWNANQERWEERAAIAGTPNGLAVYKNHLYVSTEPIGWRIWHLEWTGTKFTQPDALAGDRMIGSLWYAPNGLATWKRPVDGKEQVSLVVAEMLTGKLLEVRLTPAGEVDPRFGPMELAQVPGFADGVTVLSDHRIAMSTNSGFIYLYSPQKGQITQTLQLPSRRQAAASLIEDGENQLRFAAIGQAQLLSPLFGGRMFPGTEIGAVRIEVNGN